MNYIYDIVLNFQNKYYQFFEWKRFDKIKNITKIPVYRVSDKDLLILKNNLVTLDYQTLNKISLDNKNYKKNICLVSNTSLTIGLLFDNNGKLIKRSSLIFEEEDEVNEFCNSLPITKFKYKENIQLEEVVRLRLESEKKDELLKFIDNLNDEIILKYLYYEYFKKESVLDCNIKETLKKEINISWTNKQHHLYNVIQLLRKNNIPTK